MYDMTVFLALALFTEIKANFVTPAFCWSCAPGLITTIEYLFIYQCILFNATITVVRQPSGYMVLAFHWEYMATFHLLFVYLLLCTVY